MIITINKSENFPNRRNVEIIECKGVGHPDSMASSMAELVCFGISRYFIKKYNNIPRFNVDQIEINGGEVYVGFKEGKLIRKGSISVSGKTSFYAENDIDFVNKIAKDQIRDFLLSTFGKNILDFFNIKSAINKYSKINKLFFENMAMPSSEDTVLAVGFFPYTNTEKLTLFLNSVLLNLSRKFPIGKDVKIMTLRKKNKIKITLSIAFKSGKIENIDRYFSTKNNLESEIKSHLTKKFKNNNIELSINAADDYNLKRVYMALTGTAAEHDKGSLGRGNGISGMITPCRLTSPEVIYGKNPVYNVGKIYNFLAQYLAIKISSLIPKNFIEIKILSKIGNPINKPQLIDISSSKKLSNKEIKIIKTAINHEFDKLFMVFSKSNYTVLTDKILNNKLL
jgi:S-adenosylmethionine synthetase